MRFLKLQQFKRKLETPKASEFLVVDVVLKSRLFRYIKQIDGLS